MNPQKKTYRQCPTCSNGKVATGDNSKHNPVVDGQQVCSDCYVRELYRMTLTRQLGES